MAENVERSLGLVEHVVDVTHDVNDQVSQFDGDMERTGTELEEVTPKKFQEEEEVNSCWPSGLIQRLMEEDMEGYGPWTKREKVATGVSLGCILLCFIVLSVIDRSSSIRGGTFDWELWIRVVGQLLSIHAVNWILGYFVVTHGLHVGFARKIAHFILYASPLVFYGVLDTNTNNLDTAWSAVASLLSLFPSIKPVRRYIPLLCLIPFMAIDRKEDRPHTIEWLALQTVQMLAIGLGLSLYLKAKNDPPVLLAIPLIITAVGDGLAEPVGIIFGTHKFVTPAIWYKGKFWSGNFTRSLEGSAAVFIVSVATVAGFSSLLSTIQLIISMCVMPPIMTIVEGYAPHTCDNPLIFLVGSVIMICVIELTP